MNIEVPAQTPEVKVEKIDTEPRAEVLGPVEKMVELKPRGVETYTIMR